VQYARHFAYAAPFGANRAVTALLAAARRYMAAFDWAEALDHLQLAQGVQNDQHRPTDALGAALVEELARLRELTPFVPGRPRDFGLSLVEVGALVFAGDLEGAEEAAGVSLEIGMNNHPESWVATIYGSLLLGIRAEQGRWAEFRSIAERAVHRRVAVAFDDADACATSFELLTPHAGRMHVGGACTYGPVDATLASLASHLGQSDVADSYRKSAADMQQRLRLVPAAASAP
jgi:hypothetical protein